MSKGKGKKVEKEEDDVERLQFKVIILGDGTVGKTSLIRRFTHDEFKTSYLQTIGVDWFNQSIVLPGNDKGNVEVTLQIWDIGGQQIGSKLLDNYIFGSDAVVFAYDITQYQSFKNIQEWHGLVCEVFKDKKPLMSLFANKSDLNHTRQIRNDIPETWAEENNIQSFQVSAKSGSNVHSSFTSIAASLAQVIIPKNTSPSFWNIVKAQIIRYPTHDAETDKMKNKKNNLLKKGNDGGKE